MYEDSKTYQPALQQQQQQLLQQVKDEEQWTPKHNVGVGVGGGEGGEGASLEAAAEVPGHAGSGGREAAPVLGKRGPPAHDAGGQPPQPQQALKEPKLEPL